jgi:hypothetical protein
MLILNFTYPLTCLRVPLRYAYPRLNTTDLEFSYIIYEFAEKNEEVYKN